MRDWLTVAARAVGPAELVANDETLCKLRMDRPPTALCLRET